MATVNMSIVVLSAKNVEDEYAYEYEATLDAAGESD